ncbi:MAG TPA: transcriptional regulator [Vicinamibacteria bacterium]|nr:transcriptional regulator [Vicinamibacteria bacterium]
MTTPRVRYRFSEFTLSPTRRLLLKGNDEIPLIPRYFDLLVLLIERRNEAVAKEEIFERVWSDVIVSDGALTQAVRILRRCLGDNARDPRFIRTVSRHGYRFVWEAVVEEPETGKPIPSKRVDAPPSRDRALEAALEELAKAAPPTTDEEEERLFDAANVVLSSARDADLVRLKGLARAVVRDARWDQPERTPVPLWGQPGFFSAIVALVELRVRRHAAIARRRCLGAMIGGGLSGLAGGLTGALLLRHGPGATAGPSVLVALPLVGLAVGGLGALGVGFGLSWAEALFRSNRGLALFMFGAAGGGTVAALAHFVGLYTVEGLFGRNLSPVGGGLEGLTMGGAIGMGYALATRMPEGGIARPRGRARLIAALTAGLAAALAGALLATTGYHLGAMSLDLMAESFPGSQVSLDPLERLLGSSMGVAISAYEGLLFGSGLVLGLTSRIPRRAG